MANEPHSAPAGAWNTQYETYLSLTQRLERSASHERDALERAVAEVQDDLLDTPAPSFTAVMQKLALLWEQDLHGLDRQSHERRLILEDIEGLIQAQSALLGA